MLKKTKKETENKKLKFIKKENRSKDKILIESTHKKINNKRKKNTKNKNAINNKNSDKKIEPIQININNHDNKNYINTVNYQDKKSKKNKKIKTKRNSKRTNDLILRLNSNKKKKIINKIMELKDEEINQFSYESAILYDQRTYWRYYLSLLKTKHSFIFSFIYSNDYNSRIIKIDLFFIGFIIFYTINALFFDDNTMHKIYESKGEFDFIYQLPKSVYSSLVSIVLNKPLDMLALSNEDISKFKQNKKTKNIKKRKRELEKKLRVKLISYFIISFIFLLFFWYYLAMFGAIYKNTQFHLIKDTLISLGFSFISPFGIYLIPGLFRIPALSNKKNKRKFLYNFSKVLQML